MSVARYLRNNIFGLTALLLVGNFDGMRCAVGQITNSDPAADCSKYASVSLPSEAEQVAAPSSPPDCASYRSYRGIGRAVNYSQARACAWKERSAQALNLGQNAKEPTAWIVGGSLILADIYFNGAGVRRNISLAMRFACEAEEGMAMLALPDVTKFSTSHPPHQPFEFCDYSDSTLTMNFCALYGAEIERDRRGRVYRALESSMSPEQKVAFEKLLAAQDAYIEAHADEVDQGGTIRGLRTLGSQSILSSLFHTEVVRFERKKWPQLSESQKNFADALLHREYELKLKQLGGQTKDQLNEGAVSADHLAGVQKVWESYRDAWVAFARLCYPAAVADIRAEVTLDRYRYLKTITAYE
jgi:hypothetical protein